MTENQAQDNPEGVPLPSPKTAQPILPGEVKTPGAMNGNCEQCKTNPGSPYAFYYGANIVNVEGPVRVSLCQECVKKHYKSDVWGKLVGFLIWAGILLPLGNFLELHNAHLDSNGQLPSIFTGAGILLWLGGFMILTGFISLVLFLITLVRAPVYAFFLSDAGRERWRRKAEAGENLAISVSRKHMQALRGKKTWTPNQREKALKEARKRKR